MTNREQEILELIRSNPMISQKELADYLGITRSSVAVHISNLLKKGYVVGKGYILREQPYISIVGGTNVDIQGFPNNDLILKDSNPGEVKISFGGVGRNIGENLVKLGIETKLISAVGDDVYGRKILEESRKINLNMEDTLVLSEHATSTYLSILDGTGDMMVAIAYMDIIDKVSVDFIKNKKNTIENSKLCIIDTNIPEETIEYILTNYREVDFFLDTVSTTKAKKVKDFIGCFHTIKPNKLEAEILSGIKINNENDLKNAAKYFLEKGVKRVFISLGEEGMYYDDGVSSNHIISPKVKIINATGAGDACLAALAYSHFNDFGIDYSARFCMSAGILALSHENTINPNMSVENINKKMKEIKLC
ncbi:PfkB family carbohydrate kinase [Clostridium sp. CF012]|uniref:PfkB family carbohydrate kinase n=1 Tax=Clostridium sp. CF012 TaxID=2843319 RepID=UPI001C0BD946|nr:PfkB family carbohydrate kinase [Clostridium sp. CF012]MBU3144152.1 winged helix-turn-helix transcriptional regulator [Clostridium sp. CF012]